MTTKNIVLIILIGVVIILALVLFPGDSKQNLNEADNTQQLNTNESNEKTEQTDDNSMATSSEGKTAVYFFWGDGCPHCAAQKPFLEEMEQKYPELEVRSFEVWNNQDNVPLFQEMASAYDMKTSAVPTTFIGDFEPVVGFSEYMADDMESKIKTCIEEECPDPGAKIE